MWCERCRRFSADRRVRCDDCLLLLGRSCTCVKAYGNGIYRCDDRATCKRVGAAWDGGVVHSVNWVRVGTSGRSVSLTFRCSAWYFRWSFHKLHRRKSAEAVGCISCLTAEGAP